MTVRELMQLLSGADQEAHVLLQQTKGPCRDVGDVIPWSYWHGAVDTQKWGVLLTITTGKNREDEN